jgi:hypothetical protein
VKTKQSNYARKREYLASVNRKAERAEGAAKGARIWGFEFPAGAKPWKVKE